MSFGTMLLAAWTVLLLYVAARAATVPAVARRVSRRALVVGVALLWAAFPLGRLLRGVGGAPAALLGLLGMHALAGLFLCAVALLAVDVGTLFGLALPRLAPRLRGWALLAGVALSAAALVQGHRPPAVRTHEVRLAGLPARLDGTSIAALSDFHLGDQIDGAWLAARVAQVEELRPDLVVLVGDILEGRGASPARFVPGLARFAAPLGRFAVTGNHENHGGSGSASAAFRAAGFAVLRDGWTEAAPGLVIAGIDDRGWGGAGDVQGAAIVRALAGRPEGAVVLLAHNPASAAAAAAAGVGLMISGHTHGGQIWPFGLLVERVQPLLAGRYDVGGMALLVGRGAGTWGPRMRLWHRGEILRVVLRPA